MDQLAQSFSRGMSLRAPPTGTSKRPIGINNSRYVHKPTTIPSDPRDLPEFLRKIDIDPDELRILTLREYQDQYQQLCYDRLPLVPSGAARDISIELRNIVLTIMLHDSATGKPFVLSLRHVRKVLMPFGVTFNQEKFYMVQLSLSEPFNVSLFVLARGQIDSKGANSLIQSYLATEFLLARLCDDAYYRRRRFKIGACSIKNIVSTSIFDFAPSTLALANANHPEFMVDINHKFPGAHVVFLDATHNTNIVFLVFDKSNVICVGANRYESMRLAFERFYELARSLPPYEPADIPAISNVNKRKRKH